MNGSIRRIINDYGFIAGDDGIDYFFHWHNMSKFTKQLRYCQPGELVTFTPGVSDRGPRALNVEVIGHTIKAPISETLLKKEE